MGAGRRMVAPPQVSLVGSQAVRPPCQVMGSGRFEPPGCAGRYSAGPTHDLGSGLADLHSYLPLSRDLVVTWIRISKFSRLVSAQQLSATVGLLHLQDS